MVQFAENLIGRRVAALKADLDNDEDGRERPIPIGTTGVIERLNHIDRRGMRHYDVFWDNGGWTVYSEGEVMTDLDLLSPACESQ
jgi:hypothetical protein